MKIIRENIVWTQEMLENLEKFWVQYRNWYKVSKAMGIPTSRCRYAFYRFVKTQKGITISKKILDRGKKPRVLRAVGQ